MSAIRKVRRLREAFRALDVDEKRGIITAYNERFLFIPTKLIHAIEDRLSESFGPATATSFEYEIGREGGVQYMRIAEKAGFKFRNFQDLSSVAERLGTLAGWGKVMVHEFDPEKKTVSMRWTDGVSVRNKRGNLPVCHFGRGILTGAMETVFGTACDSLEVKCQGKGDAYCEAIIGAPEEISRLANALGS